MMLLSAGKILATLNMAVYQGSLRRESFQKFGRKIETADQKLSI